MSDLLRPCDCEAGFCNHLPNPFIGYICRQDGVEMAEELTKAVDALERMHMTDAPVPERVWILQGDAEEMLSWAPGRADTVVAGPAEITNMHGKPASVKYTHLPEELVERGRWLVSDDPKARRERTRKYPYEDIIPPLQSWINEVLATIDGEQEVAEE